MPINEHPAGVRVVKPKYEVEQRRLPDAGGPNDGDLLAGHSAKLDIAKDRMAGFVSETQLLEADFAAKLGGRGSVWEIAHFRRPIQDVEHALAGGGGLR